MNHKVKTVRKNLVAIILFVAIAGFASCEKFGIPPIPFDPNATWSFSADIQPVFETNGCTNCHNGSKSPDLRSGKSYSALSKGYINVSTPEQSRLYVKMTSTSGTNHAEKTTLNEKLKVLNWIKQGALNN
jgi:hypothetical protein